MTEANNEINEQSKNEVLSEAEDDQMVEFQKDVQEFNDSLQAATSPDEIMADVNDLRKNTAEAFESYITEAKQTANSVIAKYADSETISEDENAELQEALSILSNINEVEQQTALQVIAFHERKPLTVTTSERLISNEMTRFYHFTRTRQISISSFEGVISRIVKHNNNHEMDSLLTFMYYIFKMFNQQSNAQREANMFYYRMTLGMVMASIFSSRRLSIVEKFFKDYTDNIAR